MKPLKRLHSKSRALFSFFAIPILFAVLLKFIEFDVGVTKMMFILGIGGEILVFLISFIGDWNTIDKEEPPPPPPPSQNEVSCLEQRTEEALTDISNQIESLSQNLGKLRNALQDVSEVFDRRKAE